jgi:class 3 adenylate cyclase
MAERLGDRAWKQLLDSHDKAIRGLFETHRGREAGTTGDGFVATFDAPAQAIRCALAISAASNGLGVQDRLGIHTGEIEMAGKEIRGVAVHLAARIMNAAGPGEVFVSATAKELASGAGIDFQDRGTFELKGFAGARELFQARGRPGQGAI